VRAPPLSEISNEPWSAEFAQFWWDHVGSTLGYSHLKVPHTNAVGIKARAASEPHGTMGSDSILPSIESDVKRVQPVDAYTPSLGDGNYLEPVIGPITVSVRLPEHQIQQAPTSLSRKPKAWSTRQDDGFDLERTISPEVLQAPGTSTQKPADDGPKDTLGIQLTGVGNETNQVAGKSNSDVMSFSDAWCKRLILDGS